MLIYWAPVSQCSRLRLLSLKVFLLLDSLAVTKWLFLSVSDFFKNFSFFLCLSSLQSFLFLHYILSSLLLCLSISIIFTISVDHGLAPPNVFPSLLLSTFLFPFSKGKWTLGNPICLSYIESAGTGNVLASEMAMVGQIPTFCPFPQRLIKTLKGTFCRAYLQCYHICISIRRSKNYTTPCASQSDSPKRGGGWWWVAGQTHDLHSGNQTSHPEPHGFGA